ncbi:MAG: hypothetical protein JNL70_16230 [Saprospiraceae bacterium]|nr:hypothetical protein [Saprospiraceae bacterium]
MAKKEIDFGKLALPTKPSVIKKEEANQIVEKAVETIHASPTPSVVQAIVAEPEPVVTNEVKKISLDLPVEVYKHVKMHTFTRTITMREYMLELIYEDMKRRGAM